MGIYAYFPNQRRQLHMVTSCQALLRLFGVVLDLIVHLKNSIIIITCLI